MKRPLVSLLSWALLAGLSCFGQTQVTTPDVSSGFDAALRRFSVDHNRTALRQACNQALQTEPNSPYPLFYLGVLDESDEDWTRALKHFNDFLSMNPNADLSGQAKREVAKLPALIKEDSTPAGKANRQYRQHLGLADHLLKRGFAKEAFLETAEASKVLPSRWEAYATASSILLSQHDIEGATHFFQMANDRVPPTLSSKLNSLKRELVASGARVP